MLNTYPYTTPTDRVLADTAEAGAPRLTLSLWAKAAIRHASLLREELRRERRIAELVPWHRPAAERAEERASAALWHARIAYDSSVRGDSSRCLLAAQSTGVPQEALFVVL